jgi:hypothetical protein
MGPLESLIDGWRSQTCVMLANASIQDTTTLRGLSLCAALDEFPAHVAASSCPHGWIPAFAGMTRVGLEGEVEAVVSDGAIRHGRACPGHPRRPTARQCRILLAPDRLSIRTACEPNHVDGRDKPGHDGKWHGSQRVRGSAAARPPIWPLVRRRMPPLAALTPLHPADRRSRIRGTRRNSGTERGRRYYAECCRRGLRSRQCGEGS